MPRLSVLRGPLCDEVQQVFASWVTQTVRVCHDTPDPWFDLEWIVGPIPIDDGFGKEAIVRFDTTLATEGRVTVDANGRSMRTHTLNTRPSYNMTVLQPVQQNYFPINTAAYVQDTNVRLTVLTDRSQGAWHRLFF